MAKSLPPPSSPMLEVIWQRRFKPDLCAVDDADNTVAVIEYESTNSSDERLFGKDIAHFEDAIRAYHPGGVGLPAWWIIISTLFDGAVQRWPWWGWNGNTNYPPKAKSRANRDANPLAYYEPQLHAALLASWQRITSAFGGQAPGTSLVWVNLQPSGLKVMNISGVPQNRPLFPLNLP